MTANILIVGRIRWWVKLKHFYPVLNINVGNRIKKYNVCMYLVGRNLGNLQGWIQQCFFRGVPGESSGEGARSLGGSGGIPLLKILKIRTPEIPFPAI